MSEYNPTRRQRSSTAGSGAGGRDNVGLRQHSVSSSLNSLALDQQERATITNPSSLFHSRTPSNASIATDRSLEARYEEQPDKKLIFATNHRRSSVPGGLDSSSSPYLVYNTSYGGKMTFYVNKNETTVGRRDQNDICLNDFKVSKSHAVIKKTEKGYVQNCVMRSKALISLPLVDYITFAG